MMILKYLLAAFMVFAGTSHFRQPKGFVKIIPPFFPAPLALVYISGFFEILGGIGLLVLRVQTCAAWGLIAFYIAVFPANIYMALKRIPFGKLPTPQWVLWLRLPLQLVLIFWAYQYTQ